MGQAVAIEIVNHGVNAAGLLPFETRLCRLNGRHEEPLRVLVFDDGCAETLTTALAAPIDAAIDAGCGDEAAFSLPSALLTLRVSTATANRLELAQMFVDTLQIRHPEMEPLASRMMDALQEAVGNAVMHGNLGLDSRFRATLDGLRWFAAAMTERLANPVFARLPVTIAAQLRRGGIVVWVEDYGQGFDYSEAPNLPPMSAAGGYGLSIILGSCDKVSFSRGGRRISMLFRLPQRTTQTADKSSSRMQPSSKRL